MKTARMVSTMKTIATVLFSRKAAALLVGFVSLTAIAAVSAQQIVLGPSNVVGSSPWGDHSSSPTAWNSPGSGSDYRASTLFGQQTGSVSGGAGQWNGNTWFPSPNVGGSGASLDSGYVVIDLGAPYYLSSIELFNGTGSYEHVGNFTLSASNSLTNAADVTNYGQVLVSPFTLLGSTALTFAGGDPVSGQAFGVDDSVAYRYLQISVTAAGSLNGDTMDIRGASLSEVRVFGSTSAVPEPSTYALMAGAAILGFAVWRRRARA